MTVDATLIAVGAALLALGLPSSIVKRVRLSVPLLALAAGVMAGPEVLALVDPREAGDERKVLKELARITLAVSLVATGLQMTRSDLREVGRRAVSLLTIAMVGMWLLTSLGAWLLLELPAWVALLLGGILTPTDPVVAFSLVTGRLAEGNLPRWLRRSLQLEAGANDGLALVFVLVPALVLTLPDDDPAAIAGEVAGQVTLAIGLAPRSASRRRSSASPRCSTPPSSSATTSRTSSACSPPPRSQSPPPWSSSRSPRPPACDGTRGAAPPRRCAIPSPRTSMPRRRGSGRLEVATARRAPGGWRSA